MPEDAPARLLTVGDSAVQVAPHHKSPRRRPLLANVLSGGGSVASPRCPPHLKQATPTLREAYARAGQGLRALPLASHFIESGLWERLIEGSEITHAPAGALIYPSATAPPLLAILEGVVRVFIATAGGRQVTLRYARPGDLIGLAGVLSPTARMSTEAVTNVTVALLSLDRLRDLSVPDVTLAWPVAKQMARWGSDVDLGLIELEHRPMIARIAGHLLESATRSVGGGTRARISQDHLALAAGTAREVAARSLAELRDAGVVITGRQNVLIVDRLSLARVAHGLPGR